MLTYGLLSLVVISLAQAAIITPENSIAGPYEAGGDNLLFFDFTGSAQPEGGHIRLTPDEPDKDGAMWNNFPSISNSWEYQVLFHIHGKGVHLYGDGMALWYVRESDMLHKGPVFGSKDYFNGLGVFIDTFENKDEPHKHHRHPYISAMVNNGTLHYEHGEDGTMTQIGGCHAEVRNLEVPTKIAVSYIDEILSVYLDNQGLGEWVLCFKAEGINLPSGYHFGISASTGEVSDNHDVIAVTTLNMDPPDMELMDKSGILPEAENIQIPLKYHKKFIEEESKKVEKREAKDDDDAVEEEDDDDDDDDNDQGQEEESKPQKPESPAEKKTVEDDNDQGQEEESKPQKPESPAEKKTVEDDNDQGQEEESKPQKPESPAEKKTVEDDNDQGQEEESKPQKPEPPAEKKTVDPHRTSIWRKLIYMTGSIIILLIGVSMFKKYNERRKVIMHKRLY